MSEAISIVRILVRGGLVTLWPWLILTISFIVNLAFFAAVGDDAPVVRQSGGILALFLTFIPANQQAWTQVLPFILGLSGTRRGFMRAMGLFVLGQSAAGGIVIVTLRSAEVMTGGWGMDVRFFRVPVIDQLSGTGYVSVATAVLLATSALGAVLGAVMVRWGVAGVWWLASGVGFLVGGIAVAAVASGGVGPTLVRLAGRPWVELWVVLPCAVAAVCWSACWTIALRVSPR